MSLATTVINRITGGLQPEALPDRVQKLIRAREEESERLIGWVQLALVLTLTALFFIAPRPVDAGMPLLEPVPVALAAYGLFTVGRLTLAYYGRVPWWLLIISILVDTALLMTLIWSFHAQYGQPAAFALKVPTIFYGFVFLALRGLRFDYRYVLFSGVAFALGWAFLVWAVIQVDGRQIITRNFGTYLTSNSVLIGAEFDKIISILVVTGLLALGVKRAQAMLVLATSEEAAGREIRRFLSRGVADAITKSDKLVEAGVAVEREAAIIMLDIRGFTKLAATLPPVRMVEILTSFHARIVPLALQHNGVIDKFMGDGVMITFGAVDASKTAAADALRALDDIMAEAARWSRAQVGTGVGHPLTVNGAAAAGQVVFATLGSIDRLEFTVIGDAVNLAAKLEKHNKIAGTRALIPLAMFDLAKGQGYQVVAPPSPVINAVVAGTTQAIDMIAVC